MGGARKDSRAATDMHIFPEDEQGERRGGVNKTDTTPTVIRQALCGAVALHHKLFGKIVRQRGQHFLW
jgi:hypothetical protein